MGDPRLSVLLRFACAHAQPSPPPARPPPSHERSRQNGSTELHCISKKWFTVLNNLNFGLLACMGSRIYCSPGGLRPPTPPRKSILSDCKRRAKQKTTCSICFLTFGLWGDSFGNVFCELLSGAGLIVRVEPPIKNLTISPKPTKSKNSPNMLSCGCAWGGL